MSKQILKAAMMMAMVVGSAQAARLQRSEPQCLTVAITFEQLPERGVQVAIVDLRDQCGETVDLEGSAQLVLDGRVLAGDQLGQDDGAWLFVEIPIDGQPHQLCVHAEGKQTQQVRNKTLSSPFTLDACKDIPPTRPAGA